MRKLPVVLVLVAVALIATSSAALTGYSYYIPMSIHNTDTVEHTTRITTTINADDLVDGGYLQDDGEDIQLTNGATVQSITATTLDSTTAKWYTDYVTLQPGATTTRNIWLGDPDATRDQSWVGMEGDTNTVADAASLDITTNLTLQADVDLPSLPSSEKIIISKSAAYKLAVDAANYSFGVNLPSTATVFGSSSDGYAYSSGGYSTAQAATAGSVDNASTTAKIGQEYSTTVISNTTGTFYDQLRSGSTIRAGQRISLPASGCKVLSVDFKLHKGGSPTGTGYARIRDSGTDALIGTLGSIDVATLDATPTFKTFSTPVDVSVSDVRILFEFDGGSMGNVVNVNWHNSDVATGVYTTFDSSYAESVYNDRVFQNLTYATYTVDRTALYFDTSSISGDIGSAVLYLYGSSDSSTTDFDVTVTNGQPTYPHAPFVAADYNKTNYGGSGGTLNTSGFTISGYNAITLDATGMSWINKGGQTKLLLRSSRDISITTPTNNEYVTAYTSEESGTGKDPYLVINYTSAHTVTIAASTGNHTVKGTYDGSQLAISVDSGTPVTQASTGAITTTATAVHIGELTARLDSVKIGDTSIVTPTWKLNLEFEPDEISATTITDLSGNSNNATYSLVAMDEDIDVTVGKLTPHFLSIYDAPAAGGTSGMPVTFPDEPDDFYNDLGDYDGFPGSGFFNDMLDDAEIPRSAFWLCLFFALLLGGSYFMFEKTRDVVAIAIVTVLVLGLQIATDMGIGIIDLLILSIFYVALYVRREHRTGGL